MPNTRTMQQMVRYDFERYEEDVQDGKSVTPPLILRIDRGKLSTFVNNDEYSGLTRFRGSYSFLFNSLA